MTPYLVTALILLLITLIIRRHWLNYHIATYTFTSVYYLWKTNKPSSVSAEMGQLWPMATMLLELWRWDFARYVVYQDHYEELQDFLAAESQLTQSQLLTALDETTRRYDSQGTPADDAGRKDEPLD
jgi:hypothetical protein